VIFRVCDLTVEKKLKQCDYNSKLFLPMFEPEQPFCMADQRCDMHFQNIICRLQTALDIDIS
jgi:hypothetical protein